MPDDQDNTEQIRKQIEATKDLTETFLDTLVQIVALQHALVDAKILTLDQVQAHVNRLNSLPAVLKLRRNTGERSAILDALLRSYEGPIQ
jgi:hypothetical protein